MFERLHKKILRSMQGLPTRLPVSALHVLLGVPPSNSSFWSKDHLRIVPALNSPFTPPLSLQEDLATVYM